MSDCGSGKYLLPVVTSSEPSVSPTNSKLSTANMSPLLNLPAELLHLVLAFLRPLDLGSVAQTCHLLHQHAFDDKLWQAIVQENLPATALLSAHPASSFRELYLSHLPYWFLPKYKIWFSDTVATGKLLIARYSPSERTIEAYALAAERGVSTFKFWSYDKDVIIHTFDPHVKLDLNQPILRLAPMESRYGSVRLPGDVIQHEMPMDTTTPISLAQFGGVSSVFMLATALDPAAISSNTQVWPPLTLPAESRSRNESQDHFRSQGHRPSKISDVSQHTFRIRRWMDFTGRLNGVSMRVGEDVSTYGTLPPEAYTPTKMKPWRGIWCGDYSGHGCEFLAVLQPDEDIPLPEGVAEALQQRRDRSESVESEGSWQTALSAAEGEEENLLPEWSDESPSSLENSNSNQVPWSTLTSGRIPGKDVARIKRHAIQAGDEEEGKYSGQLLAVKLTGDPNIPRGQYTFISPDISKEGTVRIANEEIFRGARVVRSVGHIAARGYREDSYIPSQLILLSHDTLAQYWESFGHISFYKRVDIDSLLSAGNEEWTMCDSGV